MERERCDNCLYEYACGWGKAGEDLRCEEWKPERIEDDGSRTKEH